AVGGSRTRVFPSLLEGEYANVTERGDLQLRPRMGRAPLSLPSGFRGGFQLWLKRTSARYDRARRPLDRVFRGGFLEEGSRPRIAAAHSPAVGPTSTRTNQQCLRAQLHPHLLRPTPRGSTSLTLPRAGLDSTPQVYAYNSTEGSRTLNPATS
ncbi:hypothetical protein THAOC_33838, partial [Thalassiosira oceanica]